MLHRTFVSVLGVVVCLASTSTARADERTHSIIYLGGMYNVTGIDGTPDDIGGFNTLALPTLSVRNWTLADGRFNLGMHFDGMFAGLADLISIGTVPEDPYFLPFAGLDFGVAFRLAGGLASINGVIDIVGIHHADPDDPAWIGTIVAEDFYGDLGGQLHYTRPMLGRVRLNFVLQLAFSAGDDEVTGSQASVRVEGVYKVANKISVFGALTYDHRSYASPDETLPDNQLTLSTVMLRAGFGFHDLGGYGTNVF